MEPQAKYKELEVVIVSGTLTGLGDLEGVIYNLKYEPLSQEYFYHVKTETKTFWSQERFLAKPLYPCNFPGCSSSGEYFLGVSKARSNKPEQIVGTVCNIHMRQGIDSLMGQCFGSKLWVTVYDLNKNFLYHSFQADQDGYTAAAGWEMYLDTLKDK